MAPIDALTAARIRAVELIISFLINEISDVDIPTDNAAANQSALLRFASKIEQEMVDDDDSQLEQA